MHKLSFAAVLAVAAGQSCDDVGRDEYLSGKAIPYPSEPGWYDGRETWYWTFGPRSGAAKDGAEVITAPIWVPMKPDGQPAGKNIIDVLPCEDGYSDLWQVIIVNVPEDYEDDSLQSAKQVQAAVEAEEVTLDPKEILVNCPVVPPGSSLSHDGPGEVNVDDYPLIEGFYQEQPVFYFEFGEVSTTATQPVWVPQTAGASEPDGIQRNLIDTIPEDQNPTDGQPPYTPFWQMVLMNVPEGEVAALADDPVTDVADFPETWEEERTDMIVNCPVAFTAEADGGADDDDGDDDDAGDDDDDTATAGNGAGMVAATGLVGLVAALL